MPSAPKDKPDEFSHALSWAIQMKMDHTNVNQTKLADLTGIPRPTLSRRLGNYMTFDVGQLVRIAAALRVPVSSLILKAEERLKERNKV